jgi:hypothetical protein
MYKKVEVTGVPLTVELAREWAAMTPLPGERDERPSRHAYLLSMVQHRLFAGPAWACGIERATGRKYRLDGQHSSKMLASLPDEVGFPTGLLCTVETWEFDSVGEDGATLFNLWNHPKSARTNEDAMGIYRAQAPAEVSDLNKQFLVKVVNGIYEHEKMLDPKQALLLPPRERGLYFSSAKGERYCAFAAWVDTLRDLKNAAFLARAAVVGEMLNHWLKDRPKAEKFWDFVYRENHPDVDHETRTLADTFRSWSVQRKYRGAQYRMKAATAWRRFLMEQRVEEQEAKEAATARETTLAPPPAVSRGSESVNTL